MSSLFPPGSGSSFIVGEGQLQAERFSDLESVIEQGLATFLAVGASLFEIREQRHYRIAGFSTFEDYCQERWGWGRRRANRLIRAAEVVSVIAAEEATGIEAGEETLPIGNTPVDRTKRVEPGMGPIGPIPDLPENEAQTRELGRLKDGRAIVETWRQVNEAHPEGVTAADIREVVDAKLGRRTRRAARREQRDQEIRTSDAILALVGDPTGEIERARLAAECADAIVQLRKYLRSIDPAVHVPLMERDERLSISELVRDVRIWAAAVEAELGRTLRIVSSNDDNMG